MSDHLETAAFTMLIALGMMGVLVLLAVVFRWGLS